MISTDPKRLDFVLKLNNIFDYEEFQKACEANGVEIIPIGEYAQKVGMVMVARQKFPGLSPEEAYLELLNIMNQMAPPHISGSTTSKSGGCGSCGGGKVL